MYLSSLIRSLVAEDAVPKEIQTTEKYDERSKNRKVYTRVSLV